MECFQPGKSAQIKQRRPQTKTPTLADAPGKVVNNGLTIEWAHGNRSDELTAREIAAIKKVTGYKSVNIFRATNIKRLMMTSTYTQIVKQYDGKKGYSARTIWAIYSALQSVGDRRK